MENRFLPEYRLRKAADFQRVYSRRRSASDDVILVYGCKNELEVSRLGLSVSRKFGIAVRRNQWKRLIREAFRLHVNDIPKGIDWIVIPRARQVPKLAKAESSLLALTAAVAEKLKR